MLKGNDIVLKIGGVKLGAVKGCSIERNTNTIPVCSPFDGAAERHVPTTTGWSITTNGLYATKESAERLRDIWRQYQDGNHTLLDIEVVTEGVIVERGQAILTHLSDGCNVNELVKFDVQLLGSGKLEVPKHTYTINSSSTKVKVQEDGSGFGYMDNISLNSFSVSGRGDQSTGTFGAKMVTTHYSASGFSGDGDTLLFVVGDADIVLSVDGLESGRDVAISCDVFWNEVGSGSMRMKIYEFTNIVIIQ